MEVRESCLRSERASIRLHITLSNHKQRKTSIFQNRVRESELPNKAMITDLTNDISNLKKENNTLVTRLEDLRKAVRKLNLDFLVNSI